MLSENILSPNFCPPNICDKSTPLNLNLPHYIYYVTLCNHPSFNCTLVIRKHSRQESEELVMRLPRQAIQRRAQRDRPVKRKVFKHRRKECVFNIEWSKHVIRKIHHCTFRARNFRMTCFTKKNYLSSQISEWPFLHNHYCTDSLSSLHISSHHCTFCALHFKTNPGELPSRILLRTLRGRSIHIEGPTTAKAWWWDE